MSMALMGGLAAALFAAETAAPADSVPARPVFAVVPGGAGSPLAAGPKGGPPRLVWTGFQVTDAGSRVFVQTTGPIEIEVVASDKAELTVTLRNCRIHMRNNSRTLDTRFFASPVQQIAVHQRRRDVRLDIALKEPVQATTHQQPGPDGTQFWVIDFALADKVAAAPQKSGSLK
jgi:hypothetical protein